MRFLVRTLVALRNAARIVFIEFPVLVGRCIAAFKPEFWLLALGLGFVFHGANQLHPAAGWLLVGLLIVKDATTPPPPPSHK